MTSNPNATSSPSTGWIVLKFGGTSVSTRERCEVIAETVRAQQAEELARSSYAPPSGPEAH